jgi:hypothetical protein
MRKGLTGTLNEQQSDIFSRIDARMKVLMELINDLLTLSKTKNFDQYQLLRPVLLTKVLDDLVDHCAAEAESKGLSFIANVYKEELDHQILIRDDPLRFEPQHLHGQGPTALHRPVQDQRLVCVEEECPVVEAERLRLEQLIEAVRLLMDVESLELQVEAVQRSEDAKHGQELLLRVSVRGVIDVGAPIAAGRGRRGGADEDFPSLGEWRPPGELAVALQPGDHRVVHDLPVAGLLPQ